MRRGLTQSIFLAQFAFFSISAQAASRAFLYEVSKGTSRSYLFGSLHAGVGLDEVSTQVRVALDSAEVVLAEQIFSENVVRLMIVNRSAGLLEMARLGMLTLTGDLLPPADQQVLEKDWDVPPALAAIATTHSCPLLVFTARQKLLDFEVLERAYRSRKTVVNLDKPIESRWRIFSPRPCDTREVLRTFTPARWKAKHKAAADRYKRGLASEMPATPADEESRTRGWLSKIEPAMARQTVFVIVGVGHLFGERGLIQLLAERGYSVQRVD